MRIITDRKLREFWKEAKGSEAVRREKNDLKQRDLEDVFGSQAVVSKVLNGKRSISKVHAKKLAERFHLSTDAFI